MSKKNVANALHIAKSVGRRGYDDGGGTPANPPEFSSDTTGDPVNFRPLNFDALQQANAVRVTHRANPDGTTDPDPNNGFSIVSGWNDSMAKQGQEGSTLTWPNNPQAYDTVRDMFTNNPEWITPHKYRQIIYSAKQLGMDDKDIYAQPLARKSGGRVFPLEPQSEWKDNSDYKKTGGKMTHMAPGEFLKKVEPLDMGSDDRAKIKKFKKKIKKGKPVDHPMAIYPAGGQDGRHHAMAAKELGIKSVPVLTWPKKAKGGTIVDKALMLLSQKAQRQRGRP